MTVNYRVKEAWLYKVFWTNKFNNTIKIQNNFSIYDLLAKNNFSTENYFYLALSLNNEYQIKKK